MSEKAKTGDAYQRALTPSSVLNPRAITTVFQATLLAHWLGAPLAVLWFVAIMTVEVGINPFMVRRFVNPHLAADSERGRRNGAVIIFCASCAHTLGWGAGWLVGGPSASILGVLWLLNGIVNSLTYFTNSRVQFIACVAPSATLCVVIPVIQGSIALSVLALAIGITSLAVMQGYQSRDLLSAMLVRSRAERRAALQSSAAKTQFLATMSHELRTPLNAIIGYAEIIEEDQKARHDDSAADAARIGRAASHLLGLITEILDFSKIEAGKMEIAAGEIDLPALIGEVVETTAALARANNNRVAVAIDPALGALITDGGKLRQCLLNLVANACKFTQDGAVAIDARMNAAGLLQIAVKDTGCGVTAEQAALLFQPFVQADGSFTRKQGGTGLGLVITKKLAQLLGGDVVMTSTPRIGSTFVLTIAVQHAPNALPRAHERAA